MNKNSPLKSLASTQASTDPSPSMRSLQDYKDQQLGKAGTPERDRYEAKTKALLIGQKLKHAREKCQMTQEELAKKIGRQKSFISRIENGHVDIQLSTLFKIVEEGLEKKLNILIEI